jgi:hypothetical protein
MDFVLRLGSGPQIFHYVYMCTQISSNPKTSESQNHFCSQAYGMRDTEVKFPNYRKAERKLIHTDCIKAFSVPRLLQTFLEA